MLLELRELSTKQKEQIKELQKDIDTYSCEVENVSHFARFFRALRMLALMSDYELCPFFKLMCIYKYLPLTFLT